MTTPHQHALLVIDVQQAFDDPVWGQRDNPECERNVAGLIAAWRQREWPVVFVKHDSDVPGSPLAAGMPGNAFKAIVEGDPDLLVVKHVNSAFLGEPDLHAWLQGQSVQAVTICGITTNHCCETTARVAGNLGYATTFVIDATHTFDRKDLNGNWVPAEELARVTATNLNGEFASVLTTAALLGSLPAPGELKMSHTVLRAEDQFWRPSNQMGVLNTDLSKQLSAETLGARLWRLTPGQASTRHRHLTQHEVYIVLEGLGRIRVDDELLSLSPLSSVLVLPESVRQIFNDTSTDALWLVVGAPVEAASTLQMTPELLSFVYPDGPKALPPELDGSGA